MDNLSLNFGTNDHKDKNSEHDLARIIYLVLWIYLVSTAGVGAAGVSVATSGEETPLEEMERTICRGSPGGDGTLNPFLASRARS